VPGAPVEGESASPLDLQHLEWLEADPRPLDLNGPTGRPFAGLGPQDLERPIIEHLERQVRRQGNRAAISDADTSLSFSQLWDGICGLGERIAAATRPGELVGILLPDCALYALAMLASLAAGRPFLALDIRSPRDWLTRVLREARPAVIVASGASSPPAGTGARLIHLTGLPCRASDGWQPAGLGTDEPACVLFTSGSTGKPKGIVNSQFGLLQRVAQSISAAHINAEDRFLTLCPLCTIVGVRDVLTALLAGASIHIIDPQRIAKREVLSVLCTHAITILFAFPALLRSIVPRDGSRAREKLRLVRIGGDTTLWSDIDLLRAWLAPQALIQLIYAATEAPIMQWFVDGACRGNDPRAPVGFALAGNRLAVIDERGRAAAPGEIGELIVAGRSVALGTWVNGRLHPGWVGGCGSATGRVFRTGDLVRQRPDGLLERLGRKDRQVKIRGTRVDLDGVEATLRQHPGVRDVGIVARSTDDGEQILVAYVSPREEACAELLDELRAMLRTAPPPMSPARMYRVPDIPRLPSSKLDVRALRALDEAHVRSERAALPGAQRADLCGEDPIARTVAKLWQHVLLTPLRDPEDDFFAAGGDSLKAIRLVAALERELNLELPLTLINEAPGFARLCEALRQRRAAHYNPLVLLKPGDGSAPLFFVHGVGGNVAELFAVARSMAYPGPVFGLQARGLGHRELPHLTVEAMVRKYLPAIRARQPAGPYHLCGYSFGGLVAFEMARQLKESGAEVGLVGLLDTLPSPLRWPLPVLLAFLHRRLHERIVAALLRVRRGMTRRVGNCLGVKRGARPLGHAARGTPALTNWLRLAPLRALMVAASGLLASARYRPGIYLGELTLFTPLERDRALPDPRELWRARARALSMVALPGGHLTMVSRAHAGCAAASITRHLALWRTKAD
jgi:non-ribosomal peptide synthetase component F/thioesterase domain-containing protein/acyl carrier protein